MKLLMTADPIGGVWTYALELCRALQPHDVQVVLATMGRPLSAAQRADAQNLRNVALRESTFRLEWMQDAWADVEAAGNWLLGLERETSPDVVHLNGYVHAALPWSAPVLVVGHSCVLSWWRAVHGTDAPAEYDEYRRAVAAGLRAAQLVVAPTHSMLECLVERYGPLAHGTVIPNGIDQVRSLRAIQADGSRRGALAVGRVWDEAKNTATLAEVARLIDWPMYVAGQDDHPAGGRRTPAGVRYLGFLAPDELRDWYRRAAVFVHPALYEPFGLTPVEAALERCALVLGDLSTLREIWDDAACYVRPRSPRAIADAVNALARDPERLAEAGDAAFRRAATLNAVRMARGYRDAYATLVSRAALLKGAVTCVS